MTRCRLLRQNTFRTPYRTLGRQRQFDRIESASQTALLILFLCPTPTIGIICLAHSGYSCPRVSYSGPSSNPRIHAHERVKHTQAGSCISKDSARRTSVHALFQLTQSGGSGQDSKHGFASQMQQMPHPRACTSHGTWNEAPDYTVM